jgi:predicted Zn-dependent protease
VACGEALGTISSSEVILAGARASFERGDAFGARQILERGLSESADEFGLRLAYASVLLQEGELDAGYAQLVRLHESHAWSPVVQAYAGSALLAMGQVSEAQRVLDEAYARAPADFYVLLKRGELFCRLGVYQTAIDALEAALRGSIDDAVGREAARRLLRFARDRARKGFVRSLSGGLRLPSVWRWPTRWRPRAQRAATSSTQVWGV